MDIIATILSIITIFIILLSIPLLLDEQTDNIIQHCETNAKETIEGDFTIECQELLIDVYGENYCNMTFIDCS